MPKNNRHYIFAVYIFIILHRNAWILFRRAPRTYSPRNYFTQTYLTQTNMIMNELMHNKLGGYYLSNGEGDGRSDNDVKDAKEPEAVEAKDKTEEQDVPRGEETKEDRREEPEEVRGDQRERPEEVEPRSRIPTYDEFARFRDSSRPPDSHYPPGPRYRSAGRGVKADLVFTFVFAGAIVLLVKV